MVNKEGVQELPGVFNTFRSRIKIYFFLSSLSRRMKS